jgi:hypothetical protein
MSKLLARALADRHPDMRIAVGLHSDQIAVFLEVQSEFAVKGLRDRKVGDGEMKSVDGMNAELARTPGRPDKAVNLGHDASPFPARRRGIAF